MKIRKDGNVIKGVDFGGADAKPKEFTLNISIKTEILFADEHAVLLRISTDIRDNICIDHLLIPLE